MCSLDAPGCTPQATGSLEPWACQQVHITDYLQMCIPRQVGQGAKCRHEADTESKV